MLKIFSTQISGYFKKIAEQEEMNIEDSARLLAQALIGNGSIYMYGTKEMEGVALEALYGEEPLKGTKPLLKEGGELAAITSVDRVLLISRFSTDAEVVELAKRLQTEGHFIVGISAIKEGIHSLEQFTDVHIDTKLTKGLVPDEDGGRFGFPSLIVALLAYYGLKFTIDEIMAEYK